MISGDDSLFLTGGFQILNHEGSSKNYQHQALSVSLSLEIKRQSSLWC